MFKNIPKYNFHIINVLFYKCVILLGFYWAQIAVIESLLVCCMCKIIGGI